jgi:hypothetical protein
MKENVGRRDQVVRAVVGPALMGLGYTALNGHKGSLAGLGAIVGGAMLAESAVTRVCPLNRMLGIDSRDEALRMQDAEGAAAELTQGWPS